MGRVRFAPSPTGFVHVGNARTAIFNYLYAKNTGSKYILRIEDTDFERSKREYEESLIKDLGWLGVEWDEDPVKGGDYGPYRQSDRMELYKKYSDKLLDTGKAYYCFCSQDDLNREREIAKAEGKNIIYSGKCRSLDSADSLHRVANGEPAVIRFRSEPGKTIRFTDIVRKEVSFNADLIGDMILVRSNGTPAYNFTVVVDDHEMNISHVIRGEDHLTNTFKQVEIFSALGLSHPKYAHLSMIMGEDNTKLSKRHGSVSVSGFRENGYLPEALFNYLALLGWSPGDNREILNKSELIKLFSISRVTKSAAVFDFNKLNWFNREHIRMLGPENLGKRLSPYIRKDGCSFEESNDNLEWIGKAGKALADYGHTFAEIGKLLRRFFNFDVDDRLKSEITGNENSLKVIRILYEELAGEKSPVPFEKIAEITGKIKSQTGVKGRELFHPIRVALTGEEKGMELKEFIPLVEEGTVLNFKPDILSVRERLKKFLK